MAEIVTLTPNPAIDLSTSVDRILPTRKLRCAPQRRDPGGGGVNVARVVKRFGGDVEAILPVGGFTGQLLRRLIDDEEIANRVIAAEAETREDFSVSELSTAQQYRFVLPGLPLREAEWRGCLEALAATVPQPKFVVGSGSLPPGVPNDFYAQAAAIARKLGAKFVVDTSGAPLAAAIDHGVYMIKPNLREMRDLFGAELLDQNDWIVAAREYIECRKGRGRRAIARPSRRAARHAGSGIAGAAAADQAGQRGRRRRQFPRRDDFSLAKGDSLADAFRLGMAAGASALIHAGTELCRPEDAYRLYATATIESV